MSEPKFHLGLCMAGSISAGAYTAGVLDYLFETLEKWQEAKDKVKASGDPQADIPMHDVLLDVLNGSSGGGMCAILSAIMLQEKGKYKSGRESRLYKVWVDLNDSGDAPQTLDQMLDGTDLEREKKILSLLDSTFIDHVAERTFNLDKKDVREPGFRPWFSDKIEVVVTVSNTRGIPYSIQFAGPGDNEKHCMTNFKHLMKFTTDDELARNDESFIKIDFSKASEKEKENDASNIWFMQEAAKATGAFPIGLRPRTLKVPRRQVDGIHFPLSDVRDVTEKVTEKPAEVEMVKSNNFLCRYLKPSTVKPDWLNDDSEHYSFTCVDGGMTNNEPFEIARELLLRKQPEHNNIPRTPQKADRCVIMIDPFPNQNKYKKEEEYKEPEDIFSMFSVLLNIMMTQPLFKLEDIELARNDDIYSRFLIIPTRSDRFAKPAIASASLGGFGGFFDRSFRNHDFELGRRNSQKFLQKHFGIPVSAIEENTVFKGKWPKEAIERFRYKKQTDGNPDYYVPIIPDMSITGWNEQTGIIESSQVVPKQPFPTYNWKKRIPALRKKIWKRIWLILSYVFRRRAKKTLGNIISWKNWYKVPGLLIILILLLPFLLVASVPLYFIMRKYLLDRIIKPIRTSFEEFELIQAKKKKKSVV
jgi:hypothetical protein